ncbi:hypothetical protein [Moorena sp. SIO3H5]|uniref:hypothetical protein n=1 Tax=Moorena sp. SIO3H5 TaxID=2607834 RepID=UPI0013B616B5|nr:hypothetical protein [Moorena sp. SIO3H5]NEO72299.1 hypothetical protein [Moorena sp. SIO3H5]
MANLITGQAHHYGFGGNPYQRSHQDRVYLLSDAARSWEGSAVLGVPPMSDCRGFPRRPNLRQLSLYGWSAMQKRGKTY